MILLLVIMLARWTEQAQQGQYSLLKIDFETNSQREFNALIKLIKSTPTGEFVSTNQINCTSTQACPNFKIYDPFGTLLQQYTGISSLPRYLSIIDKYINLNNYPIYHQSDLQRLRDEEISLKIFQERRRLAELENSQDWEKVPQRKKASSHHKTSKQSHQKGQNLHKAKKNHLRNQNQEELSKNEDTTIAESQSAKTFPEVRDKKFQEIQHLFAWKIAFIGMIFGLVLGMKYLRHQEERINKLHSSIAHINNEAHSQYEEGQNLNQ